MKSFFCKRTKDKPQPLVRPQGNLVEKECVAFDVAVMGHTLKEPDLYYHYSKKEEPNFLQIEKTFFQQIKIAANNSNNHYFISKTFEDIALEANVTINLVHDDEPLGPYECGKSNGESNTADACIVFYDPTKIYCLDNLIDKLKYHSQSNLYKRKDKPPAVMCFIGINEDKPEEHHFNKSEIKSRIENYYSEKNDYRITLIYQISLDPLYRSENVEIIIKNLAISCLKEYDLSNNIWTLTAMESPLEPLDLFNPLEILCFKYAILNKASSSPQGIYGQFVPKEILQNITMLLAGLVLQSYNSPQLKMNIFMSMFMNKTIYSTTLNENNKPERLLTANTSTIKKERSEKMQYDVVSFIEL